ncbi:MAG TPA: hypothetical protein VHM25_21875 [Polyangiaceae bacterium]|nr:hypothetical protein [Polyangiaceae bacterium]
MAILSLCVTGCTKTYLTPALPANQLARVKFDSITRDREVDGLPLASASDGKPPSEISVAVGCRAVTVKYEASYFIWGEKKADRAGVGTGLAAALANTEQHDYETMKPIRFFIPARAGNKYWVTATFTGDEFLPRIVESDASGDTVRKFLPNEPCEGATAAPAPAALPAPRSADALNPVP